MTDLSNSPIGKSIVRKEDFRFLTGVGPVHRRRVDAAPDLCVFLRSPHAHARIRSIDTAAAGAAPGVIAIYTGADLQEAKVAGCPAAG